MATKKDLEFEIRVLNKALELVVESWCIMDNPCDPKEVVKEYIKRANELLKSDY